MVVDSPLHSALSAPALAIRAEPTVTVAVSGNEAQPRLSVARTVKSVVAFGDTVGDTAPTSLMHGAVLQALLLEVQAKV
jgi:hypothetical protein